MLAALRGKVAFRLTILKLLKVSQRFPDFSFLLFLFLSGLALVYAKYTESRRTCNSIRS